jgi:hypothetical protein
VTTHIKQRGSGKQRFRRPEWTEDESVVQLHLDFRCMPGGRDVQSALLERLDQAARQTFIIGLDYATPVLISGVVARGAPIKLTAVIHPDVVQRLLAPVPDGADARFTSLALEIGPREAVLKDVLSQQPKPFTIEEAECLLGDDFGLVNTAAAVVVPIDQKLDAEWLASVREWTKQQARTYLETHWHDGEPIDQVIFSGRNFLARIEAHAEHVDRLRSEIDRIHNRMIQLKHEANHILGLPADTRVDFDTVTDNRRLADLIARFSKLLKAADRLKLIRRQVYRSVDGLKRSWFGWVTTRLAMMCIKHKAAYVREHLTILAKEKAAPDYWGRTMNKMMNNGSKGQFLRRMSGKLKWYDVPEIVVPSWHTSSTDVRHSVVDTAQRRGEGFRAKVDGWLMHADLHAALTVALWLLLRPRQSLAQAA